MITGELKRYNSISRVEVAAAHAAVHEGTLSGFLGGEPRGGRWVRELEDGWCKTFGVTHAIACNSATSGLLAACRAAWPWMGERPVVAVSPYTMSATAAAPKHLGFELYFADVEDETFGLDPDKMPIRADIAMVTHLFGHAAEIDGITQAKFIIEDCAQSPLAEAGGRKVGTIGDIGVFSLNVHKHIQSGEGGVCVTNSDELAWRLRAFINHGELTAARVPGLNLRMTEVTAAIAYAQLVRGPRLIQQRVEIAEAIIDAIGRIPGISPPIVRSGCRHVYYTIPFLINDRRDEFCRGLVAEGVPVIEGYVNPLYRLPTFDNEQRPCPIAEELHDKTLFYYENCAYDPTPLQIAQIGDAFNRVAEGMKL